MTLRRGPDPDDDARLQELLYCEHCGTVLFAGGRIGRESEGGLLGNEIQTWEITSIEPNLDRLPFGSDSELTEFKTHSDLVVFWPGESLHDAATLAWQQRDRDELRQRPGQPWLARDAQECHWREAWLDPTSGVLRSTPQGDTQLHGFVYEIRNETRLQQYLQRAESIAGLPCVCPQCGADHRDRLRQSPIRNFRTGLFQASQVLSRAVRIGLEHVVGTDPDRSKLVAFSDSREKAAVLSAQVELRQFEDSARRILIGLLSERELERQTGLEILNALRDQGREVADVLAEYPRFRELIRRIRNDLVATDDPLADIADKERAQARLDSLSTTARMALRELVDEDLASSVPGRFVSQCLEQGICPLGPGADSSQQDRTYWSELFERSTEGWRWGRACRYR